MGCLCHRVEDEFIVPLCWTLKTLLYVRVYLLMAKGPLVLGINVPIGADHQPAGEGSEIRSAETELPASIGQQVPGMPYGEV